MIKYMEKLIKLHRLLFGLVAVVATLVVNPDVLFADDGVDNPTFRVNPWWPKELPNDYIMGEIGGIDVDANDHVWVLTRPRSLEGPDRTDLNLTRDPPAAECCLPAPPVIEFDETGNYIQGWGPDESGDYEWPENEHGITVDYKGNVWVCGNRQNDNQCLKFTRDGEFLLQIGHAGASEGSLDTENLNAAGQVQVWPATNEVFIADGYRNRRVIVFDADTGEFKRMWGAYGNEPDDDAPRTQLFEGPGPQQFNLVHGIQISNDGFVYVNDRRNSRIQVFTIDGKFVKEGYVSRATRNRMGTTFSTAFSSDKEQQFLYVADSANSKIRVLDRQTLHELPELQVGRRGPYAGQFRGLHVIETDSKGNIYATEALFVGRVQKFTFGGVPGRR